MKVHNVIGLRESLKELETEELQVMLQAELERDTSDPDSVRLILSVLEERETEKSAQLTEEKEAAWQEYQKKVSGLKRIPAKRWNVLVRAASVILMIGVLFTAIPGQANAETFWEMLQRWSANLLEIVSPKEHISSTEYIFQTDNEGLQQVYDAVVELGITEPIVPMWLPEESVLTELVNKKSPTFKRIYARFTYNNSEITYKVDLLSSESAHQYYKDDTHHEVYEQNGVTYNIARNIGRWVAVWTKENIECSITIDCQEDTLRRILESIYVMEES